MELIGVDWASGPDMTQTFFMKGQRSGIETQLRQLEKNRLRQEISSTGEFVWECFDEIGDFGFFSMVREDQLRKAIRTAFPEIWTGDIPVTICRFPMSRSDIRRINP